MIYATLALGLTVIGLPPVSTAEAKYRQFEKQLAKAKTLYVREKDRGDGSIQNCWYEYPNKWRLDNDKGQIWEICDGKNWLQFYNNKWHKQAAPKTISEDSVKAPFAAFVSRKTDGFGEWRGKTKFQPDPKGKAISCYWLKTTESAAFYGALYVDAKTSIPIGYEYSEYSEMTRNLFFQKVKLNEKPRAGLFDIAPNLIDQAIPEVPQ